MTSSKGDHLETEQKYDADADFVLPKLGSLPELGGRRAADPKRIYLSATYYDTEDLALIQHKVTLRRRVGERIELILGMLVTMSPQGAAHLYCLTKLCRLLVAKLGPRAEVFSQGPVALSPDSEAAAMLEAVGTVLREAGARPSASGSKLARVMDAG